MSERRFEFNLPAQPLGDTLRRVAETTGFEIVSAPDVVAGKQAPALSGTVTVDEALRRLLAGTGLTYRATAGRTITVMSEGEASRGPIELEPVTVLGARRIGAPLANVPASITIVDRAKIEGELATTGRIEDVVGRQVPGFNPTNEGVRKIRGRTAQVFVNGVPTNEQLRASSGSDLNLLLPEQLAQIEVSRGANSAYGFGSPGGIIALSTPRAESKELTLRTRVSESFNPHRVGGSHQAVLYQSASQIRGRFDYHVAGAVAYDGAEYDSAGRLAHGFDNSALLTNSKEVIRSFDTSLGYDLRELGRVRLAATYNHVDFTERYSLVEGVYRGPYGRLARQPRGDDSFRTGVTGNLSYENDEVFGHAIKLEAFAADTYTEVYRETDRVRRDEQDNEYQGLRSSATLPLERLVEGWFGGPFKGTSVTYGFDFIRNHYSRPAFFQDTGELDNWISPPVTLFSYAPYAQLEVPIGGLLRLTGGVRQEWYGGSAANARGRGGIRGGDIGTFGLTLFNAGAVHHLTPNFDVYATYSQGAEITQLGRAARAAGSADRIDPQPAKSDQYELGVRGRWKPLRFNAAGFYTESDLLSALRCDGVDPCTPLREPREFWGVELTGDWEISRAWAVGTVLSWMDGFREPEPGRRRRIGSREVPPWHVTPFVEYRPWSWWRNRLQLDYRGKRDPFGDSEDFGEGRVDELLLVNVAMGFTLGPGEMHIGVQNLLNERYTSIPAEAGNIGFTWLPEEGRRLKIAYTVRW